MTRLWLLVGVLAAPGYLTAQGTIAVRVVTDSSALPIPNVHVAIAALQRAATTDSTGRAVLEHLPAGTHLVVARAIGFRPDSTNVELGQGAMREVTLTLATHTPVLEEVRVSAAGTARTGKMSGYHERRERGIGRFIDRDVLAKHEHRRTADVMATVPGVRVRFGRTSKAWASSGRALNSGGCLLCRQSLDPFDVAAGASEACYMDVYIDGALVFNSSARGAPLWDLNSIDPASIEAIEVYTGGAQLPSQFNRTGGGCGAVLIWLRVTRETREE
jgi:hypothetical protein